jgi:hypothetical protein
MVANQLYELCEAVGPEPTRLVLIFLISVKRTWIYMEQVTKFLT